MDAARSSLPTVRKNTAGRRAQRRIAQEARKVKMTVQLDLQTACEWKSCAVYARMRAQEWGLDPMKINQSTLAAVLIEDFLARWTPGTIPTRHAKPTIERLAPPPTQDDSQGSEPRLGRGVPILAVVGSVDVNPEPPAD